MDAATLRSVRYLPRLIRSDRGIGRVFDHPRLSKVGDHLSQRRSRRRDVLDRRWQVQIAITDADGAAVTLAELGPGRFFFERWRCSMGRAAPQMPLRLKRRAWPS